MMADAEKREKVIRGLECCIKRDPDDQPRCSECSYDNACLNRLKMDALALLKAQEPRLVTESDFDGADEYGWLPAWCEQQTGGDVYCECILGDALKEKGIRYWTSRPTDEQREATPWE